MRMPSKIFLCIFSLWLHSAPVAALYNLCSETLSLSKSQPAPLASAVVGGNICLSRVLTGTMAWTVDNTRHKCRDGDSFQQALFLSQSSSTSRFTSSHAFYVCKYRSPFGQTNDVQWRLQSYWANYCTKSDVSQQLSSHQTAEPLIRYSDSRLLAGEHLNILNPGLGFPVCVHSQSGSSVRILSPLCSVSGKQDGPLQPSPGRKIVLKRPGSVNKIAVIEMKLVWKRMKALICG